MAASTREVYLLLRARDEASRVVRGFSAELMRSAAQAQAAALRAEAMQHRQTAAQMRSAGATRAQVSAVMAHAQALDNQARQLEVNERNQRRLAQSMGAVSSALETLGIGFIVAGGLTANFFFESTKLWADYQRQVALTRTQVDGFSASMKEVGDIGINIARTIPVAFEEIQPALFDIFSSTNANLEQSRILLTGFSKAAVAGQTDIQTAARGTIAIMNAYNIPFEKVNEVLDVQFELVRKGVGTYGEFAGVFGRIVPSATRAGQSFETVAAMLAFMTRNGQSAAMAATSTARAFEALTHPKTVGRLEDMGVKVRDAKGNFLPLLDVLTQLREKILKLPPADRVAALFELFKGAGGTIQARRFIEQVLLREGELENFRDLLKSMGDASGVMEEKFADMSDTSAAKMQLLSNRWMALKLAVGEAATPILLQVVEALSKVVEWFNNLDPATKATITRFAMWGAALAIVGGILLVFIGFVAAFVAAFVVAGAEILVVIGLVAGLGAAFVGAAVALQGLWTRSKAFRDAVMDMKKTITDLWRNAVEPAFKAMASFMRDRVLPAAKELGDFLGRALGKAIEFLSGMIKNTLIPLLQQAVKWYNENKASVDRAIGVLVTLAKWVLKIGAVIAAVFLVLLAGPVIAVITAFIAVIFGIIYAFTAVVDGVIALTAFLQREWEKFTGAFVIGLEAAKTAWKDFWETGIGAVVIAWTANVITTVRNAWNTISSFTSTLWNNIVSTVTNNAKRAWDGVTSAFSRVTGFFANIGQTMYDAGANLIHRLIEGITSKIGDLLRKLETTAQKVRDFWPFSPAKTGPLSGSGDLYKAGQEITNRLSAGMMSQSDMLATASAQLARQIQITNGVPGFEGQGQTELAPVGLGSSQAGAFMPMRSNNVTVNVYTNEIDPRMTATELGWELEGRL